MSHLDVLWEPLRIGAVEIPNRILVSSHTVGFADELVMGDRFIDYYEERARGGVGLLVTGAEGVHPTGWHPPHFQAWRADSAPRYRALADAVHRHGARVFTQLWHCGLQDIGTLMLDNQHPVLGPSAVPSPVSGKIAKAMDSHDIEMIVEAFAHAAMLAQVAGIDGVEVSGAHGYLVNSFLSPLNNRRSDEYGGSVENRCRFAIEVGQAIRARCGVDFPVGIRLSAQEFVGPGGFTSEDSAEQVATMHAAGVFDYFSISGGTYHTQWATSPTPSTRLGTPYVDDAARATRAVGGEVPVMVAAGISTVARAAEIVGSGAAAMAAMTRAHIADPRLVAKARAGRASETRRCVGFNQGCIHRQATGGMSSCTVNPAVGREGRWGVERITPADRPQSVVVVGGGPAGMKFAETAAQRGHRVTLIEREQQLGGLLNVAARLPDRERWLDFVEDLRGSLVRHGAELRIGEEATVETIRELDPDFVAVATGATFDKDGFSILQPGRTGIPGAADGRILDPVEAVLAPERCGDRVVVIDEFNGSVAVGVAQLLGEAGKRVHLVTVAPTVGAWAPVTLDLPAMVYPRLVEAGVEFLAQKTVTRITADKVSIADVWTGEARDIPVDSVVVNMLRTSQSTLYDELLHAGIAVGRIGDAVAPRQVDEAVFEGMELGLEFDTDVRPYGERAYAFEASAGGVESA